MVIQHTHSRWSLQKMMLSTVVLLSNISKLFASAYALRQAKILKCLAFTDSKDMIEVPKYRKLKKKLKTG